MLDFTTLLPRQSFLRSLNLAYSYIDQDKDLEPNLQSQYALQYLRHKFVANLKLHLYSQLNMALSYRYQDRVGNYQDVQGTSHEFAPYSLVDARLSWDSPKFNLYVEANNLLDKTYYDYGSVPQPGIWIMAGGNIHFNF